MAFFDRVLQFPPLSQIVAVPQIVVIDSTGPNITFGTQAGAACLVGEFIAGTFSPNEVDTSGDVTAQYTANGTICPYLSQDGSSPPVQNGTQVGYNGNGLLQLLKKTFQRLILVRVDHEALTTDGGATKAALTLTLTIATADQLAGVTNKDITIPAGARFGSAGTFAGSTRVFACSGNVVIPKGTTVSTNSVTASIPCFPIRVVEPVVATAIAAVAFVLDPVLPNVDPGTTITAVNNATALWPSGTGTTLATRIESQYPLAINKTAPSNTPMSDIVIIWAARRSSVIRQAIATNALSSSTVGRGRIGIVSADPAASISSVDAAAAVTAAIGLASADGYVQPADRVIICFPMSQVVVPDFGNIAVTINSDGWMATTLANFPEEYNPGAANAYVQGIANPEPAFVANPLAKQDYINLIAAGVCALYFDRQTGWQWMQGVTAANSVVYPTRTPIKRRRMADLIEDTLAQIAAPYQKGPVTQDRLDAFVLEIEAFLDSLLSPNLPAAQRIVAYKVDTKNGNTAALNSQGIYIVNVYVTTLPSLDFPVFQCQIGETVVIPTTVSAAA